MALHVVIAVVDTVSVDVCAAPLIVTEAGERLHVAGSLAAVGEMAQLRLTVPVKPLTEKPPAIDKQTLEEMNKTSPPAPEPEPAPEPKAAEPAPVPSAT